MWAWLGPLLLAVSAVAAGGLLWHEPRQVSPEALFRRQEGLRLLAADDAGSLQRAAEILVEAARLDPGLFQARADRALALTLAAADDRELVAGLEAEARPLEAERSRLEAGPAEGGPGGEAGPLERLRTLEEQIQALRARADLLEREAAGELRAVAGHRDDPAVVRAVAMRDALAGELEQARRPVDGARADRLADPWLDMAEAVADLMAPGSEVARERAAARLGPLAAAYPDLLRARMLLARAEADLGRVDAAVAALDAVLEANPAHQKAWEAKARLLQPPPVEPLNPRVSQQAPPPGRPGLLPRKQEGAAR